MKTLRTLLSIVVVLAGIACSDDGGPVDPNPDPPVCFDCATALDQRGDVLPYFEAAFNARRVDAYDRLLDENFEFVLAPGDVAQGLPPQWNRAEEMYISSRLLDKNYSGPFRCAELKVDLIVGSDVQWSDIDPQNGSEETWYRTTVFNEYRFEIGFDTYLSKNGAKVELTVRNAGTAEDPAWRLVQWRELDTADSFIGAARVATDTRSWGEIKSLYRP